MPKKDTAPFIQSNAGVPIVLTAACVLASGANNQPTNTMLVGIAGEEGGLVRLLSFLPRSQVLSGVAYFFSSTDNGTTQNLIGSQVLTSQTPSSTVPTVPTVFPYSTAEPYPAVANEKFYVGASAVAAAGIVVDFRLGNY